MRYKHDHEYERGLEVLKEMKGEEFKEYLIKDLTDEDKKRCLLYYIEKREEFINTQKEKIMEYQDFFRTLDKFLPKHNIVFK